MTKETQSTIEQIQRWIKSNQRKLFFENISFDFLDTNTNRDPYPFVGVIEALRGTKKKNFLFICLLFQLEAQPSSTSTSIHQPWSSMGNPTCTKTVYESTERFN